MATALAGISFSGASAQGVDIQIGPGGVTVDRDCNPRYERCRGERDWRRDRRHDDDDFRRSECTTDRALMKASRMGIRRARVVDVGRRSIEVRGIRRGDRVEVSFSRRDRSCPIIG
ncbi:hypothetical protein ASD44_00650 [Mesorhizobium sp. Root554]|nr:hypothetical protein ASD27_00650 [Mesorhizobium sp. Root1471]KQZ35253.1 hypothetical protein ASD44_00650 [Mesorhizobium sp. Root554]